jgi:hypothetical protein
MATNLKEFFNVISKNIDLGEDFDLNQIPEVELPNNFNDDFHQQYLTPLSAKNNKDIMKHFRGQYLNTVDSRLKSAYLANGGSEDSFNDFKSKEPDSMKLIDVVLNGFVDLTSSKKATSDELEAYKIKTSKQIKDLLGEKESFEDKLKTSVDERDAFWKSKLQGTMVKSILNAKQFNDSMSREDSIYLTTRKISDSPYLLELDENMNKVVREKDNPSAIAIKNGENLTWESVLDELSEPYTKKNDQPKERPATVVQVPTNNDNSGGDGRFIVGHKDYGKR